jgi:hypothetical protein
MSFSSPLSAGLTVFAVALLFALAMSHLPAQPVSASLLYAAAAGAVAGEMLYAVFVRRRPKLDLIPLAVALAALSAYAAYSYLAGSASQRLEYTLQSIEKARQVWLEQFSRVAGSVGVVVGIVEYALYALAPVTGGATLALAPAVWAVGEAVDVVSEAMAAVAGYLGYAYAMVSILLPVVRFTEHFSAVFVPLSLIFIRNRKGMVISAYLALMPLIVAYAASNVPALPPPTLLQVPKLPFNTTSLGAVLVKSNAWVVAEFEGPNGTKFWYSIPPGSEVKAPLPAGNWTLTRAIYAFTPIYVGAKISVKNGTIYGNYTFGNATGPGKYIIPSADRSISIDIGYRWAEDWQLAATRKPDIQSTWVPVEGAGYEDDIVGDIGSIYRTATWASNATWVFEYSCYGTASQCGTQRYEVSGVAADFVSLYVRVLYAEDVDIYPSTSHWNTAVSPIDWGLICRAATSPLHEFLGADRCPAWRPAQSWTASVEVRPIPEYENGTEVPKMYRAKAAVVLLYRPVATPVVSGFAAWGPNGTLITTASAIGAYFTYGFLDALKRASPADPTPLLKLENFAAQVAVQLAWAIALVGWGVGLVYTLVATAAAAAGLLLLLNVEGPLLRLLGLEHFISPRLSLRMGNVDVLPFQFVSSRLTKLGAGSGVAASATGRVTGQVTKAAVAPWIAYAKMWALYSSSMLRWFIVTYRNPWIALANALAAVYVAKKVEKLHVALPLVKVAAPKPFLRPAAKMLEALVNVSLRSAAALASAGYRYGKALHYIMHPSGFSPAERAREGVRYLTAAMHLRIDYFIAKYYAWVLKRALAVTGNLRLAALWTITVGRPPRHQGDVAAWMIIERVKGRPLLVTSASLAEGFRRFRIKATPEQAAALWLRRYGYSYSAIKAYLAAHKIEIDPAHIPASKELRLYLARHGVEMWARGDPHAHLLASIKEFRLLLKKELGIEISSGGAAKPVWNLWLRGAAKAAVAEGNIEAKMREVLRLPPGAMGERLKLSAAEVHDHSPLKALRRELEKAKEDAVEKIAKLAGRAAAEKGVWGALADPNQSVLMRLDAQRAAVLNALKQAVQDVIPPDLAEKGAAALTGEQLAAIYELVKAGEPQPWFTKLPEHIQEKIIDALPYGDWSYAYSVKYAAQIADISWREITPHGQVVEHKVLDYLPASVREAVVAQRLSSLEALQTPPAPPLPPAPPPDWRPVEELAKKLGVIGYETPQGEVKIKVDAVAANPEEARRMIIEAARLAAASEQYYDEGAGLPKSYKELADELKKLAGSDYDVALKKTVEFFMTHAEDLADLAAQEGDLEAVDAVFNILREAGREVRMEAEERPVEPVGEEAEAVEDAAEPAEGAAGVPEEEVVESAEEAVEEGEAAAAEVDLEEEERRAREALRRLGIDLDALDRDAFHAEDLSRRYGIPREVASDLVKELGPRGAEAVAEDFRKVDRWMREAGLADEERAKILSEKAVDIAENPKRVIEELAERLAQKAPKELRDLVAGDLKKGNFEDVNWKLSQIEKYCAAKGGCSPEERRGLYRRL